MTYDLILEIVGDGCDWVSARATSFLAENCLSFLTGQTDCPSSSEHATEKVQRKRLRICRIHFRKAS
jgi:hypothetical protein